MVWRGGRAGREPVRTQAGPPQSGPGATRRDAWAGQVRLGRPAGGAPPHSSGGGFEFGWKGAASWRRAFFRGESRARSSGLHAIPWRPRRRAQWPSRFAQGKADGPGSDRNNVTQAHTDAALCAYLSGFAGETAATARLAKDSAPTCLPVGQIIGDCLPSLFIALNSVQMTGFRFHESSPTKPGTNVCETRPWQVASPPSI